MPLLWKASDCVLQTVAHTEVSDTKTIMILLASFFFPLQTYNCQYPQTPENYYIKSVQYINKIIINKTII